MKIIACNSSKSLSQKISNHIGVALADASIRTFNDREIFVEINENIRGEDVFIVQSTNPPSDNILELLLILDAAKRASAKSVVAVIPYFGYGRQDRKDRPRVPISARMFLDVMSAVGVNIIVSMDLHSSQIQGFANVPFDHLYSRIALFSKLKELNLDESSGVVLAPDVGSAKMSQAYAKTLGVSFALIDKRRPKANEAVVANLVGDLKNKHVLIIDDMIDTAGTIVNAADAAMEAGAKSVIVVATHGVLSGPAIDRLSQSVIKKVIITDTISIAKDKLIDKIKIVSVANIFGKAVSRVHNGESVSALFEF